MFLINKIVEFNNKIIEFFKNIAIITLGLLVISIIYDLSNRYFFNNGSIALQEFQWHLYSIFFLFGLSYTHKLDENVRVDIFYENFSKKSKFLLNFLFNLLIILPFVILVLYVSIDFINISFLQNEISSNPNGLCCRFFIKSSIFIGFFLLFIQTISSILENFVNYKK
jgi:TRAP-type mannitol/chloroaromatic compound transport system permease small subunit